MLRPNYFNVQMFKKVLITGVNGQVGAALQAALAVQDVEMIALNRQQLDLTRPDEIQRILREIKPDLIINPAAYTAVDKAESEPELAFAMNARAPQILAEEAARQQALLVHYSTDYVYDGSKTSPYIESDETNPLRVYGKSKLAGELAIKAVNDPHIIFRTSWVYNATGKNFFNTILRLGAERNVLNVVHDQCGAPTSAIYIAEATLQALSQWHENKTGVYHLVNAGQTTWYDFSVAILQAYEARPHLPNLQLKSHQIRAISSAEYPTPAPKPINSCLSCEKLKNSFDIQMTHWHTALLATVNEKYP